MGKGRRRERRPRGGAVEGTRAVDRRRDLRSHRRSHRGPRDREGLTASAGRRVLAVRSAPLRASRRRLHRARREEREGALLRLPDQDQVGRGPVRGGAAEPRRRRGGRGRPPLHACAPGRQPPHAARRHQRGPGGNHLRARLRTRHQGRTAWLAAPTAQPADRRARARHNRPGGHRRAAQRAQAHHGPAPGGGRHPRIAAGRGEAGPAHGRRAARLRRGSAVGAHHPAPRRAARVPWRLGARHHRDREVDRHRLHPARLRGERRRWTAWSGVPRRWASDAPKGHASGRRCEPDPASSIYARKWRPQQDSNLRPPA